MYVSEERDETTPDRDDGPFEALTPLGPRVREASLRFTGRLQGRHVSWTATLRACASEEDGKPRRYIDVRTSGPGTATVTVGLPVDGIDEPTALKTVIMLRQWKALAPGRHEF